MLTRHLACLAALGLPMAVAGTAQAQGVKFNPRGDYDLLIRQSVTQAPGATARRTARVGGLPDVTYRQERFHQGWMRMDGLLDETGSKLKLKIAEQSGYMLANETLKQAFNIRISDGKPVVDVLPSGEASADALPKVKPTGETLTIAGEACNVMTVDIVDTVAKTCVTRDGLTLRMEMQQGSNIVVHEAVKLNWRPQNAADFVPPAVK